jgi:hypothetical protein
LIVIVLAQLQMAMTISALPVSLGPIAEDLPAPATAAAMTLLRYFLFVAAFVMLGAKIGNLAGERLVLEVSMERSWPRHVFTTMHASVQREPPGRAMLAARIRDVVYPPRGEPWASCQLEREIRSRSWMSRESSAR